MAFPLIQSATGNVGAVNATSVTVTVASTGSGNLLVAFVTVSGTAGVTITAPTGWSQVGTTQGYASGSASVAMFYKPNSTSGVTSVVFSFSVSCNAAVAFEEWSSVATSSPLDQFVAQQNAKTTAAPTGTTAALAASGELAIWGLAVGASSTTTYSAVTNGYVEDTSANAHSAESSEAQATLFYNTNVGSAATSSAATMNQAGGTGNTTILAVFKATTATPALTTSPTTLSFTDVVGGSGPATQNDTLTNTGGASSAWTSAISYGSGSGWLGIAASSGTLAASAFATIVFTCTTGALAAGTYTATVTFTATTGGSTATVTVTFVVSAASTGITYANYKNTIEPQLVAALNVKGLLNYVQLIGPDTTMANDVWLTNASTDLKATLSGYVRHAFPTGASDISNDSRETAIKTLVVGIYANDPTAKPVIQGEMGFAAQGPGQSVALYQYGVEMADYAVQLARAGMAALIGYILDDDMHGVQWGMWQISDASSTPRPWAWIWAVLSNTLIPGSQLYASAQPTSNDFRFLAALSPQGAWTFVLVNRKAIAQNIQVIVSNAPVASTNMSSYVYSNATPLLTDGNGFALASGTITAILSKGFTVPIAANSVLVLSQATAAQNTIYDVKRAPLQRRR